MSSVNGFQNFTKAQKHFLGKTIFNPLLNLSLHIKAYCTCVQIMSTV